MSTDKTYRPMPIFINSKKIDIKQVNKIEKADCVAGWNRNIRLVITMDDGEIYQYSKVFGIKESSDAQIESVIKKYNEIYSLIEPYTRGKETILFYTL